VAAPYDADLQLAAIARGFDVLLDVTPVNGEEAWDAWQRGERDESVLRYRPVGIDPEEVLASIDAVDVEVDDPAVARLLEAKAEELRLYVALVATRGTPRFLDVSHDLYGTADDDLLALARQLLERLPPESADVATVSPQEFAARAEEELARYRRVEPDFAGTVVVRDDIPSLMVVQRELYVGTDAFVPADRVEALVHHEVGTHLFTAETGGRQPLHLLEHGLARYEETQEALGLLAEHLVGGLDAPRLRVLAGRAVAARCRSDGAGLAEIVAELEEGGFSTRAAWLIAVRIVRGGGLTKDVVYLRGLVGLVDHLAAGGSLDPLLVGKLHLDQLADVEDLLDRGVLVPAALRPLWLEVPGAEDRLDDIRGGRSTIAGWG
jgi:uncharacterized protein (TIGR02421 family)